MRSPPRRPQEQPAPWTDATPAQPYRDAEGGTEYNPSTTPRRPRRNDEPSHARNRRTATAIGPRPACPRARWSSAAGRARRGRLAAGADYNRSVSRPPLPPRSPRQGRDAGCRRRRSCEGGSGARAGRRPRRRAEAALMAAMAASAPGNPFADEGADGSAGRTTTTARRRGARRGTLRRSLERVKSIPRDLKVPCRRAPCRIDCETLSDALLPPELGQWACVHIARALGPRRSCSTARTRTARSDSARASGATTAGTAGRSTARSTARSSSRSTWTPSSTPSTPHPVCQVCFESRPGYGRGLGAAVADGPLRRCGRTGSAPSRSGCRIRTRPSGG